MFSQVGVALLSGKTGAPPAADGAEPMAYEKEAMTTEGGLEATVEVRHHVCCCYLQPRMVPAHEEDRWGKVGVRVLHSVEQQALS